MFTFYSPVVLGAFFFLSQQLKSAAGSRDIVGPAGPSLSQLRLESLGNLSLTCSLAGVETGGERCVHKTGEDNDNVLRSPSR